MNDAILLAVDLAFALSLEMVIWSAGLIAFTTHFLAPERTAGKRRWILVLIILLYLASILFGAISLMSFIGELTDRELPDRLDLYKRLAAVRWAASSQALTFLVATAFTAWLALIRILRPG